MAIKVTNHARETEVQQPNLGAPPLKTPNGKASLEVTDAANPPKRPNWRVIVIGAVMIILLLAIGIVPRVREQTQLTKASAIVTSALPVVELVSPQMSPTSKSIYLPGTIEAIKQTAINARATGYVQKVFVDIGDQVRAGQTLATITAPDTDQEVVQASAQLAQSQSAMSQTEANETSSESAVKQQQANVDLAKLTVDREKYLFDNGAVAKQEYDQAASQYKVNLASLNTTAANVIAAKSAVTSAGENIKANQANLNRMAVLQSFEKVTAPFAGTITARNVDPGAYISGGGSGSSSSSDGSGATGASASGATASGSSSAGSSSASSGGSLFSIGSMDRLRIYVNLPQDEATSIQIGQPAVVTISSLIGKEFKGTLTHTTVAMDPLSRTLVAEVRLNNPNHLIRPGMFGNVQLDVATPSGIILIPDPALLTDPTGAQVIVVAADNKVHYQTVQIGQDNGEQIQILSGLNANQRIVGSPTYDLIEGEEVRIAQPGIKSPAHANKHHA